MNVDDPADALTVVTPAEMLTVQLEYLFLPDCSVRALPEDFDARYPVPVWKDQVPSTAPASRVRTVASP